MLALVIFAVGAVPCAVVGYTAGYWFAERVDRLLTGRPSPKQVEARLRSVHGRTVR